MPALLYLVLFTHTHTLMNMRPHTQEHTHSCHHHHRLPPLVVAINDCYHHAPASTSNHHHPLPTTIICRPPTPTSTTRAIDLDCDVMGFSTTLSPSSTGTIVRVFQKKIRVRLAVENCFHLL